MPKGRVSQRLNQPVCGCDPAALPSVTHRPSAHTLIFHTSEDTRTRTDFDSTEEQVQTVFKLCSALYRVVLVLQPVDSELETKTEL